MEMTPKDHQILQYCCENFTCKICNNILMQCITLSCGHHFCNYCLELLHAGRGALNHCPHCASPVHRAQPNGSVDQQIDNLIEACSESIQKAYASALDSRFQKSWERNKMRQSEEGKLSFDRSEANGNGPKDSNCFDQIIQNFHRDGMHPLHPSSVTKNLKSARTLDQKRAQAGNVTPNRHLARPRSKPITIGTPTKLPSNSNEAQNPTEIDMSKVNLLFGIYDHVLRLDNEPNKEMAAGDFVREEELQDSEFAVLEGMTNFSKRSEVELENLIKETDDIVRLDNHIQKWTTKMKDALWENNESPGLADENFDKSMHVVDDELWKASTELLHKLQGMQKQCKIGSKQYSSYSCPPTPWRRSHKVNLDEVSDDSEAEEYEQALETLQECLDNSYDISIPTPRHAVTQEEDVNDDLRNSKSENSIRHSQQKDHHDVGAAKNTQTSNYSGGERSARKKNILECMEESGHNYIKENIEFITKMRKYKEALMKIQNREVVTAQEIKELVPTTAFPSDGQDATRALKCGDVSTPRHSIHINQTRRSKQSYSARLPLTTTMDRRPMTASYEQPTSQQFIHKRIPDAPAKQYLKPRCRASSSLFTAR